MSLKYEPSSELLLITAKQLFLNQELAKLDLEAKNLSVILFTEGRVVGLCWEKLKPKGPKGPGR